MSHDERVSFAAGGALQAVVFASLLEIPVVLSSAHKFKRYVFDVLRPYTPKPLILRREMNDALNEARRQHWVKENALRLLSESPEWCAMHQQELGGTIVAILNRARAWGLTQRGSHRLFLDLAVALGPEFDTSPAYPWVAHVLSSSNYTNESHRAEALFVQACERVPHISEEGTTWV